MKIAIAGALGRMGCSVLETVQTSTDANVSLATVPVGSDRAGQDYGVALSRNPMGILLQTQLHEHFDVLIDFTTVEASMSHVAFCRQHGKAIVLGTTGFSLAQQALLRDAGEDCPVFWSPNMSIGVYVLGKLVVQAAALLKNFKNKDIDIVDVHHRHKKDAPSGTALKLGELIAAELGLDLTQSKFDAMQEHAREDNRIGFSVRRTGEVVGEHTAIFNLPFEQIQLSHVAHNRRIFADGALQVARWLKDQPVGYYGMQDFIVGV
jgi:4-hydroxy-tetrahydrodipicolinate reductase